MNFGAKWHQYFDGSWLNKATYARRLAISCVRKASACHHTLHANLWHCLWKILPIIAVKKQRRNFHSSYQIRCYMFYCGRIAFTVFKHADIKGMRQRLTSIASLDDGDCGATNPVGKGHHVTCGRSAWNGSRSEHICASYVYITNIHGLKLKISCYNRD